MNCPRAILWEKLYPVSLKSFRFLLSFSNVPARYAENRKLGIWVSAQRQQKKLMESTADEASQIKSTPLTQDRIDLLDEIGFTWTIRSRDSLGESWNQRLAELKAYKEKHGNCLVPSRYNPEPRTRNLGKKTARIVCICFQSRPNAHAFCYYLDRLARKELSIACTGRRRTRASLLPTRP